MAFSTSICASFLVPVSLIRVALEISEISAFSWVLSTRFRVIKVASASEHTSFKSFVVIACLSREILSFVGTLSATFWDWKFASIDEVLEASIFSEEHSVVSSLSFLNSVGYSSFACSSSICAVVVISWTVWKALVWFVIAVVCSLLEYSSSSTSVACSVISCSVWESRSYFDTFSSFCAVIVFTWELSAFSGSLPTTFWAENVGFTSEILEKSVCSVENSVPSSLSSSSLFGYSAFTCSGGKSSTFSSSICLMIDLLVGTLDCS